MLKGSEHKRDSATGKARQERHDGTARREQEENHGADYG